MFFLLNSAQSVIREKHFQVALSFHRSKNVSATETWTENIDWTYFQYQKLRGLFLNVDIHMRGLLVKSRKLWRWSHHSTTCIWMNPPLAETPVKRVLFYLLIKYGFIKKEMLLSHNTLVRRPIVGLSRSNNASKLRCFFSLCATQKQTK